jgi:hypothetical protein
MPKLKRTDAAIIDKTLDMGSGYVLNFSDRTMADFFDANFNIDIDDARYRINGGSKAKRLRTFIELEEGPFVASVLRSLWDRSRLRLRDHNYYDANEVEKTKDKFFEVIRRLEGADPIIKTDAIERFVRNETLEELVMSIERDIQAKKPAAALDRLHTYCMKKFGHLLDVHGIAWERKEPLHSRAGKYVKALQGQHKLSDMSKYIVKTSVTIFEKFNFVRNDGSLAHDNILLSDAEARFIFDSTSNLLRFLKSLEPGHYGA